jgi:hypothetical protein
MGVFLMKKKGQAPHISYITTKYQTEGGNVNVFHFFKGKKTLEKKIRHFHYVNRKKEKK